MSEIKAVHDDDLGEVLRKLRILDDISRGIVKCYFCETIINTKNIAAIFPKNKRVNIVCSDPKCFSEMNKIW